MATEDAIDELRRLIAQPDDEAPYDNTSLSARIDGSNVRAVAAEIWTEKAAAYAELVDVQEGSSRRSLGDMYEQALSMAEQFGASPDSDTRRPGRTRQIVRP